jgi:peptidoglycan/LPS O-acetylase OafA/YrhL
MDNLELNSINDKSNSSSILDFLRFSSAVIVFLYHFTLPLPGSPAVMVFFVLSGYFISSSTLNSLNNNRWSWKFYLINRVTRLWIVLIPGLLLTLMWAKIQFSLFGVNHIATYFNMKGFLGCLFFTQGILNGVYGLNVPLWSLSYEFWYYILFPCILLIFYSKKFSIKIFYLIFSIAISYFVGRIIMEYFVVWLLGAAIPLIKPINIISKYKKFLLAGAFFLILILATKFPYEIINTKNAAVGSPGLSIFADYIMGFVSAIFVYIIVSSYKGNASSLFKKTSKYLAGFSYTLYLTHYPVFNFYVAWRESKEWTFTGLNSLLIKMFVLVIVMIYAWIVALLTEKHTDIVRRYITIFIKGISSFNFKSMKNAS